MTRPRGGWEVSTTWGFVVAFAWLALQSTDRHQRVAGLTAAALFLVIVGIGQALKQLPDFLTDPSRLEMAMMGMLAVRFALLKPLVVAVGYFAWRTTRDGGEGIGDRAWRVFGWLVLAVSVAFLFVFVPPAAAVHGLGDLVHGPHRGRSKARGLRRTTS